MRDASRAKNVVVLTDIAGTTLDKGDEIDALGKLPEDEQRKLASAAKTGMKVSAKQQVKKVKRETTEKTKPETELPRMSMTSVRKKTSNEIFRTPRWLRGPPRSLRSIINPEAASIYRGLRKAIIQELRPKTPIDWIWVNEYVNSQFSDMRYGTWEAAVMQFSVAEGLRRAVKNRLRSGNKGSEADLDWRAQELAGRMRPYVNDHAIEAEMYLSRRSEMDSIHRRQLSAQRRRDSALRQLEQRRSRQQKEAAQIARALIDERNREEFAAPEMATIARKNGAGDAPELKTAGTEPLRKSQNGHGQTDCC